MKAYHKDIIDKSMFYQYRLRRISIIQRVNQVEQKFIIFKGLYDSLVIRDSV